MSTEGAFNGPIQKYNSIAKRKMKIVNGSGAPNDCFV